MPKTAQTSNWKIGSIRDWIALTRAEHAIIVAIAIAASEFVVAKRFSPEMLFPVLGPALITLAAFAWNDYFGVKTDKALKRIERPLVSGRVGRKTAFYASLALFVLGLTASAAVNQTAFAIAGIFTALAMLYDPILKKLPLLGNAFIASSMSISFIYGNYAFASELNYFVLLFAIVSFTAGLARELVLTLRDVKGDRKIGAKTFPMAFGTRATVVLAIALFHVAVVMSLMPFAQTQSVAYAVLIGITDVLILISAWRLALDQRPRALKKKRKRTAQKPKLINLLLQ